MARRLRGRSGVEQRKRRLMAEPLCRDCMAEGTVTAATVPDHIVPLAQGGTDTDDNIRCLCAEHHRIRTAEQFGRRPKLRGRVDVNGWPVERDHPWNAKGGYIESLPRSNADTGGALHSHSDLPRSKKARF